MVVGTCRDALQQTERSSSWLQQNLSGMIELSTIASLLSFLARPTWPTPNPGSTQHLVVSRVHDATSTPLFVGTVLDPSK